MNHKPTFIPRLILLMLLLALPVLACSSLTGGDEDSEKSTTADEIDQADSTDNQEGAADSGEVLVDEPPEGAQDSTADDAGDSSADTAAGSVDGDGAAPEATAALDPESTGNDETREDPADIDSNDEPRSGSESDESDSADSDGDQDTAPADGPSPDGWGASGSGPQSACDHPYLPLRPGATWTYNDGQDTLIWEVIDVQGDLNNATAVLQITVGDIALDYQWNCAEGEGLASFDFANLGSAASELQMTLEQISSDGQFLLPADQLQPGATWETNLESAFSFSQGEGDVLIEVFGDMINVQTNEVISTNPVTFDGLTVDGVQLEQADAITMVMTVLGNAINQNMSFVSNYEFGRGIGMISQSSATDFGPSIVQLVSYYVP